ncbi:MAG: hypothetical protein LRY73_08440 [Bacillus sp. (in: Bacteria)]|nr:hypothetical protein [Bacillus sp. (in: firmicutes)]
MTMVTQIPITLVTGISELVKLDVIKEMKRKDKSNVILYRDLNVTYKKSSEEFTLDEKRLTSVIHDLVADNKKDLLSIINIVQNNDGTNHIVIDVEMEATLQLLTRFGMTEKDPLPIQNHIHVVDANKFWFQYASMDSLLKASIIEETTEMYIGELLGAQLELANMIVLANADHLNEERLSELFLVYK